MLMSAYVMPKGDKRERARERARERGEGRLAEDETPLPASPHQFYPNSGRRNTPLTKQVEIDHNN